MPGSFTHILFYHLSDEMAETGNRTGESHLFTSAIGESPLAATMTACIVARHVGWKSAMARIPTAEGTIPTFWWLKVFPETAVFQGPPLICVVLVSEYNTRLCRLSPQCNEGVTGLTTRKYGFCLNTVSHLDEGKCFFNRTQEMISTKNIHVGFNYV